MRTAHVGAVRTHLLLVLAAAAVAVAAVGLQAQQPTHNNHDKKLIQRQAQCVPLFSEAGWHRRDGMHSLRRHDAELVNSS
jgi:uncharacterized protein HemX